MDASRSNKPSGLRRKASLNVTFCVKKERNQTHKKISTILQKAECDRSAEETQLLEESINVVKEVEEKLEKRRKLKLRSEEVEDQPSVLAEKCKALAEALSSARHLVVYSGAGVSTAARIPDYRGTNGIWTRLQQGKDIGCHDLSQAEPTLTHMALFAMYQSGIVKHIVSQNCDGLHLRSGLPKKALSEVHGNMYLEVCTPCGLDYWRLFDVTEHTARYSHETARLCFRCRKPLRDTIVHFGERGALKWPLNWSGACDAADNTDLILCIGSSLKVLKKYPWLWGMDRPVKKRPSLYIVNLQWTPKDDQATLKINGKCDEVMTLVMSHLGLTVPKYERHLDPIFTHATLLLEVEQHTTSQPILQNPLTHDDDAFKQEENIDCDSKPITDGNFAQNTSNSNKKSDNEDVSSATIKTENGEVEEKVLIDKNGDLSKDNREIDNNIDEIETAKSLWRPFTEQGDGKRPLEQSHSLKKEYCEGESSGNIGIEDNSIESAGMSRKVDDNLKKETSSSLELKNIGNGIVDVGSSRNQHDCQEDDFPPVKRIKASGGNIETAGFSIPVEEFEKIYTKIGKEVARRNSNEFFREFYCEDNRFESVKRNNCNSEQGSISNGFVENKGKNIEVIKHIDMKNYCSNISCGSKSKILAQASPLDLTKNKSSNNKKTGKMSGEVACEFCKTHYKTQGCQFYKQHSPVAPAAGPFCYCCDDEDENSDGKDVATNEKAKDVTTNEKAKDQVPVANEKGKDQANNEKGKDQAANEKASPKVPIVNPGWFGKGYRKKYKKKR
ncbi:NAD-dependent protein deacetylase Sirt7 [Nilaparvata lugens]|uniref:NAD-dependent protein deacetylase Sirt7 n=1 Tax=Nilaparvata lugens TaxID=108931 RepID=UPI00193D9D1B|nr:NAD-dependent protein deacetylase Sirt7 [Nilaparvata lugens]